MSTLSRAFAERSVAVALSLFALACAGCGPAPNPLVGAWSSRGEWLRISEDGAVAYVSNESSGTITARSRHTERSGRVIGPGTIDFERGTVCTVISNLGIPWREGPVDCAVEASGSRADVRSDGGTLVLHTDHPVSTEYTRWEGAGLLPQPSLAEVAGRWEAGLTEEFELQRDGGLDGPPQVSSSWMRIGADGELHYRKYFKNYTDATLTDLRGTLEINGGSASTSALTGVVHRLRPAPDGGWDFTEDPSGVGAGVILLLLSPDDASLDIWGFRVDTFTRVP